MDVDARVAAFRAFNRFYTRRIGALDEHLLDAGFGLAQSRLLYELAQHDGISASELARELALDAGYLSRLVASLKDAGLLKAERDAADARRQRLRLTAAGRRAFAPLDRRSHEQGAALLARLGEAEQAELLRALASVRRLLDEAAPPAPVALRAHGPGDVGWIVERHGALYAREYGWDARFEALVAQIGADFLLKLDVRSEACWIAEREGERLGSVMLVRARDEASGEPLAGIAQLRLLLVEPAARGHGLGARLVAECDRFALAAGYRTVRLWTNSVLVAARAIYRKAGYRLVGSEPHHSFGHALVGEIWEKALR